jgi:hypothetical protein
MREKITPEKAQTLFLDPVIPHLETFLLVGQTKLALERWNRLLSSHGSKHTAHVPNERTRQSQAGALFLDRGVLDEKKPGSVPHLSLRDLFNELPRLCSESGDKIVVDQQIAIERLRWSAKLEELLLGNNHQAVIYHSERWLWENGEKFLGDPHGSEHPELHKWLREIYLRMGFAWGQQKRWLEQIDQAGGFCQQAYQETLQSFWKAGFQEGLDTSIWKDGEAS